jgi:hypothetical protein
MPPPPRAHQALLPHGADGAATALGVRLLPITSCSRISSSSCKSCRYLFLLAAAGGWWPVAGAAGGAAGLLHSISIVVMYY